MSYVTTTTTTTITSKRKKSLLSTAGRQQGMANRATTHVAPWLDVDIVGWVGMGCEKSAAAAAAAAAAKDQQPTTGWRLR